MQHPFKRSSPSSSLLASFRPKTIILGGKMVYYSIIKPKSYGRNNFINLQAWMVNVYLLWFGWYILVITSLNFLASKKYHWAAHHIFSLKKISEHSRILDQIEWVLLTLIGTFHPLFFLDQIFFQLNFYQKILNFLEVKIDINQVNLTPYQAHWVL